MLTLAVTSSTSESGFGLFDNTNIIVENTWTQSVNKSDALVFELDSAMKKKNISYKDIGCLLLDIGPGSFTGCRISANLVKSLAMELSLPVNTINSLDLILFQSKDPENTVAAIDANKSLYYVKKLESKSITLIPHSEVKAFAGSFALTIDLPPKPSTMVQVFSKYPKYYNVMNWAEVEPLYIRSPEVSQKK